LGGQVSAADINQVGTPGDDTQMAIGTPDDDNYTREGLGGDDTQYASGAAGNDIITQNGGDDNDRIISVGGSGTDHITQNGGNGNDVMTADVGSDNDQINQNGGAGNDDIFVNGGPGNDNISILGGDGDDKIRADGDQGHDQITINAGNGNDEITYDMSSGNDVANIIGGLGRDTLTINAGILDFTLFNGSTRIYTAGNPTTVITISNIEHVIVIDTGGTTLFEAEITTQTGTNGEDTQIIDGKDFTSLINTVALAQYSRDLIFVSLDPSVTGSVNIENIVLQDEYGNIIPITASIVNNTLSIRPMFSLSDNTHYTLIIPIRNTTTGSIESITLNFGF